MNNLLGTASSIVTRYLVAQHNLMCRQQAAVFSAIDMIVSHIALHKLKEQNLDHTQAFCTSRIVGFVAASLSALALGYTLDPVATVAMTVAGIAVGVFVEYALKAKNEECKFFV